MKTRILAVVGLLEAGAVLGSGAPARAQVVFPLQNPSVRSAGMGGASAAVVWSGDLNHWANPALLGYGSGLTVRWTGADLSYFTPPVRFRSGGVDYGWGGLGLSYGHDGIRLDVTLTDPFGNPVGSGQILERGRRWGGGLSLARLLQTLRVADPLPGLARHADLALGFARKRGDLFQPVFFPFRYSTKEATDLGLLARVTPLPEAPDREVSLDLAYGYSVLEEPFYEEPGGGVSKHRRHGIGVRIGRPLAPGDPAGGVRGPVRWLTREADPVLNLTIAADFDRFEDVGLFGVRQSRTSRDLGAELALSNALALRVGHVRDEIQGLDSFCFGGGIGVPIAGIARVRYDYARFPSRGLDREGSGHRHAVSVWFDPPALVRP